MTSITFNTLAFTRKLQESGFDEKQAETVVELLTESQENLVTNGGGHLLNTSSAAGLLTQIGSLHYSVTKNAAVSLAEWISVTYGDRGIGVSVLCPQAVATNLTTNRPPADLMPGEGPSGAAAVDGVLTAAELADTVVEALADGRFHVLPHPDVAEYVRRKGDDVDRWLGGMRRFQSRLFRRARRRRTGCSADRARFGWTGRPPSLSRCAPTLLVPAVALLAIRSP